MGFAAVVAGDLERHTAVVADQIAVDIDDQAVAGAARLVMPPIIKTVAAALGALRAVGNSDQTFAHFAALPPVVEENAHASVIVAPHFGHSSNPGSIPPGQATGGA